MTFKRRSTGYSKGYRSGLEEKIADQLKNAGIAVEYEKDKLLYKIPSRVHKYTPDWKLPKAGGFFYVETKGLWSVQDRAKILFCINQIKGLDLRMVFSNQNAKLYKGSPTTYAAYCEKHGIRYANKWIPEDWLEEARKGEQGAA
jgi:predicted nuclease of restriction endonuclease-like RecB superfamily